MLRLCRNQVVGFTSKIFGKQLLKSRIQVKMEVDKLHLYLNVTLPQVFLKHFASKNQLPGLSEKRNIGRKWVKRSLLKEKVIQ